MRRRVCGAMATPICSARCAMRSDSVKPGVPGGIELHKSESARGQKLSYGKAVPLALAMRQWDGGGGGETDVIRWL